MLWCVAYNCINSSKNNPDKTFFILPKNDCTDKAWTAAINQKQDTPLKNVYLCSDHFEETYIDKSWAMQAKLFHTSCPKERKLVDGSVAALTWKMRLLWPLK